MAAAIAPAATNTDVDIEDVRDAAEKAAQVLAQGNRLLTLGEMASVAGPLLQCIAATAQQQNASATPCLDQESQEQGNSTETTAEQVQH